MLKYLYKVTLVVALLFAPTAFANQNNATYLRASEILVGQGGELLANEEYLEALGLFEQAMVANPQNVMAYLGLGKTHRGLGNSVTGLRYFTVALELEPTNLDALELQALLYLDRDEVSDAERNLTRIRRICGGNSCETSVRLATAISSYLTEKLAQE